MEPQQIETLNANIVELIKKMEELTEVMKRLKSSIEGQRYDLQDLGNKIKRSGF